MRIPTGTAAMLMVALTACSATQPTAATAPTADPQEAPPPGASAKLSPEMVGKVSPVPAFMGQGEHFRIQIQSEGGAPADGLRHRVHLVWGMGSNDAKGTLFYRGAPGPSRGAPIALDGTLDTAKGSRTIRVEIATEPCIDDADVAHPQRVNVTVQGETRMTGCGELAVY